LPCNFHKNNRELFRTKHFSRQTFPLSFIVCCGKSKHTPPHYTHTLSHHPHTTTKKNTAFDHLHRIYLQHSVVKVKCSSNNTDKKNTIANIDASQRTMQVRGNILAFSTSCACCSRSLTFLYYYICYYILFAVCIQIVHSINICLFPFFFF
jgi:hypothetical protein